MLTIFGSIVLDTLHTPGGSYSDILGGAATYAALAASHFVRPGLVARGGGDLEESHMGVLRSVMDIRGLGGLDGKTFRYEAAYLDDFRTRRDIRVEPNVPEGYEPRVPEAYRGSEFVYLANEDPAHQMLALRQFDGPDFAMCDTIGHWIRNRREDVVRVLGSVDAAIMNDEEARELAGSHSLEQCARTISGWGARYVIIKRGAHGSILFGGSDSFPLPAYPVKTVEDPTGAGDSFGGALMGHLARAGSADLASLRRACIYGNVAGSLAVEQVGTGGLIPTDAEQMERRARHYRSMTNAAP